MKQRPAAVIRPSAIRWRALIVLALLASSCAGLPPPFGPPTESPSGPPPPLGTPPPHLVPTLAHNPELANDPDLILFMTALADQGVIPLSSDTSQNPILRPAPGLGYRLPQGHLHVHVYPRADDAHHRATQAQAELAQSIADWIGTPHLFECGRLLAMYFGDDPAELAAVGEACMASQSAPGTPTPAPTNSPEVLVDTTTPAGAEAYLLLRTSVPPYYYQFVFGPAECFTEGLYCSRW
jgi:hypothetical protein